MSTRSFSPAAAAPPAVAATADVFALVRTAAARATIAVGLAAIAVIHAVDSVGHWSDARYLFWMYMALIAAAIGLAGAVLLHRSPLPLLAAAGLAALVFVGYVISRTVGLPDGADDIGNWTEPLGLASLVVEGMVVAVGLAAFRAERTARLG
jgi:hypothetical protein